MSIPNEHLYNPRFYAPEPGNPCRECGSEDIYHLFRCSLHEEAEETYTEGDEGIECFICEMPKPHHLISCYRGADFGPHYRLTSDDFNDLTQGDHHE